MYQLKSPIAKILDEIFDEQFSLIENEAKSAGRFTTTPEYDRKMQRLIKKVDRPLWAYTNTPLKRVACILAIIVFISVTSITVHAIYKKFFEFKCSQNTQFTEIFTKDIDMATAPDTILTRYTIDVPQGYEFTFESPFEEGISKTAVIRYADNSGSFIRFEQFTAEMFKTNLDNEHSEFEEYTDENGNVFIINQTQSIVCVAWNNGEYIFKISSNNLNKEELCELCTSTRIC